MLSWVCCKEGKGGEDEERTENACRRWRSQKKVEKNRSRSKERGGKRGHTRATGEVELNTSPPSFFPLFFFTPRPSGRVRPKSAIEREAHHPSSFHARTLGKGLEEGADHTRGSTEQASRGRRGGEASSQQLCLTNAAFFLKCTEAVVREDATCMYEREGDGKDERWEGGGGGEERMQGSDGLNDFSFSPRSLRSIFRASGFVASSKFFFSFLYISPTSSRGGTYRSCGKKNVGLDRKKNETEGGGCRRS